MVAQPVGRVRKMRQWVEQPDGEWVLTGPEGTEMCIFNGTLFKEVPGYDSGYGCPCCKGLSYHIEVTI